MIDTFSILFTLNLIRLKLISEDFLYFTQENVIPKIADIKTLKEFHGEGMSGFDFCMRNLSSANFKDFKELLLYKFRKYRGSHVFELRKFLKRVDKTKQYRLLRKIKIREY